MPQTALNKMDYLKKNFFFDTSILSHITFFEQGRQSTDVEEAWGQFLNQMDTVHPIFADTDFTWIHTPALFLELVGFGQIRQELRTQVSEIHDIEWKKFVSPGPEIKSDDFCEHIAKRIRTFLFEKLPAQKLYRQATVCFLRKYKPHFYSQCITAGIKQWAKKIRDPKHYMAFTKAIFLDTLFRYPFIDPKQIGMKERHLAMHLWAGVMGRLARIYFEVRSLGFEYSALGLFAELNKIGGWFNSPNPDLQKYDILIRAWDDIADADSINFALLGKNQQSVNIVTLEKKTDIERRLLCLARNLKEMNVLGFKTDFYPGTVTIFSQTLKITDFFSVQDVVDLT